MNCLYVGNNPQMLSDALKKASELLGTENLDNHADYLFIDVPDGKKSIGVEEADSIVLKTSSSPVYSERFVVVINHFELMTIPAQNKLLLLIESGVADILGVAYTDALLDTIKSRMQRVEYRPVSFSQFCKDVTVEDTKRRLAYYVSKGCPLCMNAIEKVFPQLCALYEACIGRPSSIFEVMHLVKEKDNLAVSGDRQLMYYCILTMEYVMEGKLKSVKSHVDMISAEAVIDALLTAENDVMKSYYSKDDFFLLVTKMFNYLKE